MAGETWPGPCIVCGRTNYPLSAGGPTICPACDCGDSGPAVVNAQRIEIERLRECLRECAEDLAAQIEARYPKRSDGQRTMENRYLRDMTPVFEARLLLKREAGDGG